MTVRVNGEDIAGGGGATLPATPTEALLDAGAPSTFVSLDAAGVGATLTKAAAASAVQQTRSVAGSSFTATAGLGTATASTLTMTAAVQTSASWADQPRLAYNHGGDPWNVSVTARLAALTGGDGNTYAPLALRNSAGDLLLMVQVHASDGAVSAYGNSGGNIVSGASTMPLDGTGAFRVVLANAVATVYQSTDSGVNWRPIARANAALPATTPWLYTYVTFNLYQGGAPGGTVTVQWADVVLAVPL